MSDKILTKRDEEPMYRCPRCGTVRSIPEILHSPDTYSTGSSDEFIDPLRCGITYVVCCTCPDCGLSADMEFWAMPTEVFVRTDEDEEDDVTL